MATIRAGKRRAAFSFSVDMLTGSPLKKMLIFGLPLFAVNVLNMLTSALTVTIYNKFVGGDAFYIPSLVSNAVSYIGNVVGGVVSATMICVAQAKGADDPKRCRTCLFNAVYAVLLVDIVLCVVFVAAYRPVFRMLHVPAEAYGNTFTYYALYLATYMFTALGSLLISAVAAYSNIAHIFILNVMNSCFHVAVSAFLLGVLRLGLAGVAVYAAVNAVFVGGAGLLCLSRNRGLRPERSELKPDWGCIFRIIRYGLLLSLQSIFCSVGYLLVSIETNARLSPAFIATLGVALPISAPMTSMSSAVSVFCAQNCGAGNEARLRKGVAQALVVVELYALICMLFNVFAAPAYWNFMFKDTEMIRLGVERWRYSAFGFLFVGILYVLRFALDSMGYGRCTIFCGVCEFIMQLFCAYMLIPKTGVFGASVAQGLSWGLSAVYISIMYAVIIRKRRKERSGTV